MFLYFLFRMQARMLVKKLLYNFKEEIIMRIMTNVAATFAARQASLTNFKLNRSLEKLSSGLRINRAGDDAAGLAISEKFRTQIAGFGQAQRNVMDGISLIQTAEGGLEELTTILQRMRVLAVQASSETLNNSDRALIQAEISQLTAEIGRMNSTVQFNGIQLLSGNNIASASGETSGAGSLTLQIGSNNGVGEKIVIEIGSMSFKALGLSPSDNDISLGTAAGASSAIVLLDSAITTVATQRANLGAYQNRLEHTHNFLGIQRENMMASESRIRDVDFATEMTEFTKQQILSQAGNAMLSQANLQPQMVLQLLG
jgi:flagellin